MRISELSRETGVPVATIKFYLREHLLPEGVRTSATQAQYGEEHVARLRLVRALIGPGGLSLNAARRALAAIDDPPERPYDLIVAAGSAVSPPSEGADHTDVHALLARWGVDPATDDCSTHDDLAVALQGLDAAGFQLLEGALELYREQMSAIARFEIDRVPTKRRPSSPKPAARASCAASPIAAWPSGPTSLC